MNDVEIAMYVDRRLSLADRDRVEAHLAACPECREEVLATRSILRRAGRPRRLALAGALAAAAALLVVVAPQLRTPEVASDPLMRAGADAAGLVAYGPVGPSSTVRPVFVWSAAAGAAAYRLTVSRGDGVTLWSQSGTDTARSLPDTIMLRPGTSYWWVADALLEDGSARSTGLREFRMTQ